MQRIRIHFEDHGQDFLWWDIEHVPDSFKGKVVDCGPFQFDVWVGASVFMSTVEKNGYVHFISEVLQEVLFIKYPIVTIEIQQLVISDPGDEQPNHHIKVAV